MIVDFTKSYIEWQTKTNSKGRFVLDATLQSSSNLYCLGQKVLACNVYNVDSFFKEPSYSFQALISNNEYSIYRIYLENLKDNHTLNNPVNDFKSFKKYIVELKDHSTIESYPCLLKVFSQKKNMQAIVNYNNTELQFPIKHININESTNQFQVETGEVLILYNNNVSKAYITFSAFNYAELLVETEKNKKYTFNERLNINSDIKIIAS